MKTFATKKKYLVAVYYFLKSIPPKDIPTMDDMRLIYDDILPQLKESVSELVGLQEEASEIQKVFGRLKREEQKLAQKEADKKLADISLKLIAIGDKDESGEVEFEDKTFGTMFDILKKQIKVIFKTCEDTVLFERDLDASNSKPKEIPKKIEPKK